MTPTGHRAAHDSAAAAVAVRASDPDAVAALRLEAVRLREAAAHKRKLATEEDLEARRKDRRADAIVAEGWECLCPNGHGQMTFTRTAGALGWYWICPACDVQRMWPDGEESR